MKLTENEKMVLDAIISESNFNCGHVDLNKPFSADDYENGECYEAFATYEDYGCGLGLQAWRAVMGSLSKKGLICLTLQKRQYAPNLTWITIDGDNFARIKEALQ